METSEIIESLNLIFRKVLKRENIILAEESTARDVPGWDSLTNMILISEIEKTFHIRFSFREIVKFKNVGDLCRSIIEKQK